MRFSPRLVFALLAVAAIVALVAVLAGGGGPVDPLAPSTAPTDLTAADVVPYDGRSPREPDGSEVRVLIELRRPPLGALPNAATLEPRLQRRHVASLQREGRALRSGLDARGIEMRDVVTFQRLWNGFAATVDAKDLPRLTKAGL